MSAIAVLSSNWIKDNHGETIMNIEKNDPTHSKGTLVFSSDHAGFEYKAFLKEKAQELGYIVIDCGTYSTESVDYPDYIKPVVKEVLTGAKGVMICGSGIGMSMAANRFKGIRAALCFDGLMAQLAREHNDANILVLGERVIGKEEAASCLEAFLTASFQGGRHARRVEKMEAFSPACT
ncbi:MAG TPA: ribose 5-phosphate isomerase B [Alphaproteobacteria bacterium]|nr:ribose 5-phosphate isomerase B [Alphaproteobacteria bacterium]